MRTPNVQLSPQSQRLFFCTTCRCYRGLASFFDTKYHIFTAKCKDCRIRSSTTLSSSSVKTLKPNLSVPMSKSFSPVVQRSRSKLQSLGSSIIPQAKWVCVGSGSQETSYAVYPAHYLFHRCIHSLWYVSRFMSLVASLLLLQILLKGRRLYW